MVQLGILLKDLKLKVKLTFQKPNEKDVIEEDAELLALRQAALQSKKQQHIEEHDGPKHTVSSNCLHI